MKVPSVKAKLTMPMIPIHTCQRVIRSDHEVGHYIPLIRKNGEVGVGLDTTNPIGSYRSMALHKTYLGVILSPEI